jgi:hypothetical protein
VKELGQFVTCAGHIRIVISEIFLSSLVHKVYSFQYFQMSVSLHFVDMLNPVAFILRNFVTYKFSF